MGNYRPTLNPYTGRLQKVLSDEYIISTASSINFKEGVATVGDLPSTGNTEHDGRIANDTHHLYIWDGFSWQDQGDIIDITWEALEDKPVSAVGDIDDAVTKRHAQNSDVAIYAGLSDSTDQAFASAGTAYSITFDTNDEIAGITHSTSVNPENITIVTTGVYTIFAQPQVTAGAGGAGMFHMWLQKDIGAGFVDVANTNVELSLSSLDQDVIPLSITSSFTAGDIVRLRASVSDNKIKLDAQTPANEPAIPSVIFTIFMIGT